MRLRIYAKTTDEAKVFTDIATKYDFNVDVKSGKNYADGKSLLGVCSLCSSLPLDIDAHGGTSEQYSAFVNDIKAAGLIRRKKG